MAARTPRASAPAYTPIPRPTAVASMYTVPSKTYPSEVYTTDIRDRAHPTCTCPAGQAAFANCKHVKTCWHVRTCLDMEDTRRHALIPVPTPAPITRPRGMAALQEAYPAQA